MMHSKLFIAPLAAAVLIAAPSARAGDGSRPLGHAADSHHVTPSGATRQASATTAKGVQVVELTVTKEGFEPASVSVKHGKPVKLVVTRKVDRTCATEIVMKDFGVNQPLPLDKPVTVEVTPKGPAIIDSLARWT